jgi:hypothetical protein
MWLTFSGLYGIIYPRYNDFITTDVRTSNPIRSSIFYDLRFKLSASSWLSKAVHISAKSMDLTVYSNKNKTKTNSVVLVRKRIIPTERPLLVGEVSANFCG